MSIYRLCVQIKVSNVKIYCVEYTWLNEEECWRFDRLSGWLIAPRQMMGGLPVDESRVVGR